MSSDSSVTLRNGDISFNVKNIEVSVGYQFVLDNCQICKCPLSAPPVQELNNETKKNIEMTVSVGKCGDIFHRSCIKDLKKNNNISCPICNVVWKEEDILRCEIGISE
jgi:RING-H2 zinc finger domain